MKKKIVGIFVCMLMITTALPATGFVNDKITWFLKENNFFEPYQNAPSNSPNRITIKIVAKVVNIDDPYNLLGGIINVNDTINGKYTYDSEVPDGDPEPTMGEYLQNSSSCGIKVKAGGLVYETNASDTYGIVIFNDVDYFGDSYVLISANYNRPSNGLQVDIIMWWLHDSSCTALSSDALPTTAPVLSDFNQSADGFGFIIFGSDPYNLYHNYMIQADVIKATKSKAKDIDGVENGWRTFLVTMLNQHNIPFTQLWIKILEKFRQSYLILQHLIKQH